MKETDKILLVVDGSTRAHTFYFLAGTDERLEEPCATIEAQLKEFASAAGVELTRLSNWLDFKAALANTKSVTFPNAGINKLAPFSDPLHAALFNRLQLLLPFHIEAATFIAPHSDANWSVFLLLAPEMEILALATCYAYFYFPEGKRHRVSQVLVFPEHQHLRKGVQLYGALMNHFQEDEECHEVCVEDPTDRFERMRGVVELELIREDLLDGKKELKQISREQKIPLMQVRRLNNVLLHQKNDGKKAKLAMDARKETKKWLFKKFGAELDGLEAAERKSKLEELYEVELEEFIYPILERTEKAE